MPKYLFEDPKTGDQFEIDMKISERDEFVKNNPHLTQLVNGFPGMVDPTRIGRVRPDDGFRDVLKEVKKRNRGANINTW